VYSYTALLAMPRGMTEAGAAELLQQVGLLGSLLGAGYQAAAWWQTELAVLHCWLLSPARWPLRAATCYMEEKELSAHAAACISVHAQNCQLPS